MKRRLATLVLVAALIGLVAALIGLVAACGPGDSNQPESPTTMGTEPASATETSGIRPTVETELPSGSSLGGPASRPMADSIEYARSLGGASREGETLFFVIGAETDTEQEAQRLLEEAQPYFGDMVNYFIVQKSDNFEGMAPGKWVVFEAYDSNPSAENREFGQRAFPSAYVVQATVRTADPIPVFEDRLGL